MPPLEAVMEIKSAVTKGFVAAGLYHHLGFCRAFVFAL